jgi:hypothetical protein
MLSFLSISRYSIETMIFFDVPVLFQIFIFRNEMNQEHSEFCYSICMDQGNNRIAFYHNAGIDDSEQNCILHEK